jgi:hypothetical protein
MTLEGIDVSYSNVVVNAWADFVVVKATQGATKDPRYDAHYRDARALGVPVGAYGFLVRPSRTGATIADQVDALLTIGLDADGIAFDWEGPNPPAKDSVRQAMQLAKDGGRRPGLYASDAVYFDAGQDWTWIAHYGSNVWPTFAGNEAELWQWQGSPLDRDRFRGTATDLLRLWEGAPPESDTGGGTVSGWFPIRYPGGGRYVHVSVAAGKTVYRLDGGGSVTVGSAGSGGWGASAIHDVPGGSPGFSYTSNETGTAFWVRASDATIDPTP